MGTNHLLRQRLAWAHPWTGLRESLRARLGLAALAGLVTTAVLTGLLLLTADAASTVVGQARDTHERLRIYSHLLAAANTYQEVSYQGVRKPGGLGRREVVEARARLVGMLAAARQLPTIDGNDRETLWRIQEQGQRVLQHFARADVLVDRVDGKWRRGGTSAAMNEIARISQPIVALQNSLEAEIRRDEWTLGTATSQAQVLIRRANLAAMIGLALALTFSLAVLLQLHFRLRPGLRRLEQGAQAFGAGQFDHRIALSGHDELARLAQGFDAMARTLTEKRAQLHEVQVGLELAVASRTRALRLANAELSTLNERRRTFLADISHELRTPLTIIRGETEVALRLADRPGFDAHDVLERILAQTCDLTRMVNDLFLIGRAQAGVLPLELRPLDLRDIVTRIAGDFDIIAAQTGSAIRALPGAPLFAEVDADRLRRAIAALIENALKHCHAGVAITLQVEAGPQSAAIAVCDDGPGVDFARAGELFERFRRGESRGEGSGLGLSLVSALAEAHGGSARLEPNAGGGTRAVMELPLPVHHLVAA